MRKKNFRPDVDVADYTGTYSPYDIVREGTIALVVVLVLTFVLATLFGSPDEKQVTLRNWSNAAPVDFAGTALNELNGSSLTATYGGPYNTNGDGQKLGPFGLAKFAGVRIPVNASEDFVLMPLLSLPNQPTLHASLVQWTSASASQQNTWTTNYAKGTMTFVNGHVVDTAVDAGPVPLLIDDLTSMARTGALDQALIAGRGFYATDYTKPLLFLADGGWFAGLATQQHLTGNQWGMMNETGSYPGQAWLWLYTFWYQIDPYKSSSNADVLVWGTMMVLTAGLILAPLVPGVRSIPRWTKVYKIIWREHYKNT